MKKLNVYIVKQILVGFLLVAFSLMSILWLTQSLRFCQPDNQQRHSYRHFCRNDIIADAASVCDSLADLPVCLCLVCL